MHGQHMFTAWHHLLLNAWCVWHISAVSHVQSCTCTRSGRDLLLIMADAGSWLQLIALNMSSPVSSVGFCKVANCRSNCCLPGMQSIMMFSGAFLSRSERHAQCQQLNLWRQQLPLQEGRLAHWLTNIHCWQWCQEHDEPGWSCWAGKGHAYWMLTITQMEGLRRRD